ncbi:hypothetical protein, partial [Providencia rettgeri]|uniref:hypothetical protein n=1 Tax=Providencia rettgeri TaxID=587 RepID=UPI001C3ECA6F
VNKYHSRFLSAVQCVRRLPVSKEYPEVVCDCKLPDDCTLEVEIEFGQQKETYRQNGIKKDFFILSNLKVKIVF